MPISVFNSLSQARYIKNTPKVSGTQQAFQEEGMFLAEALAPSPLFHMIPGSILSEVLFFHHLPL